MSLTEEEQYNLIHELVKPVVEELGLGYHREKGGARATVSWPINLEKKSKHKTFTKLVIELSPKPIVAVWTEPQTLRREWPFAEVSDPSFPGRLKPLLLEAARRVTERKWHHIQHLLTHDRRRREHLDRMTSLIEGTEE